jgi:hypothetical protein
VRAESTINQLLSGKLRRRPTFFEILHQRFKWKRSTSLLSQMFLQIEGTRIETVVPAGVVREPKDVPRPVLQPCRGCLSCPMDAWQRTITELIPSSFGLVVEGEDGLDDGGQTVG